MGGEKEAEAKCQYSTTTGGEDQILVSSRSIENNEDPDLVLTWWKFIATRLYA
jgi:hypothetical protein